jgi:hypothetical protein
MSWKSPSEYHSKKAEIFGGGASKCKTYNGIGLKNVDIF